ncbi:MAG: hypothetical protein ACO4CS_18685 [bacterium]
MALINLPSPSLNEGESTADALLKIAASCTSQHAEVLSADTNYTGKQFSAILFLADAMTITSITMPNVTGSLAGLACDAGFLLPVEVAQIQVSGGKALGFKYGS